MLRSRKKNSKPQKIQDNIYIVERILERRVEHGMVFYKVKWEGYPDLYNTWEPDYNIMDRNLVRAFDQANRAESQYENDSEESEISVGSDVGEHTSRDGSSSISSEYGESSIIKNRFDDNISSNSNDSSLLSEPEKDHENYDIEIVGATTLEGKIMFVIKSNENVAVIPNEVMKEKNPQTLIKFYESHFKWQQDE